MLLLFSCYYHVDCTACDPVPGQFFKLRFGISGCADGGFVICNLVALHHKHGCTDCAPEVPKIFNMKS